MTLPPPDRLAHHEAGHAIVQHWVARGRFRVTRVSLATGDGQVAGCSLIDGEVSLGLYEFGLVVLAGIAAENRYFSVQPPPADDPWGAVGDTDEWLAAARVLLQSQARIELVTHNVLRRLADFFAEQANWSVVTELAKLLLAQGAVDGEQLQAVLERLPLPC